jgi:hypothetical protein
VKGKVEVTVQEAPFRTFDTLRRLDVRRLEKAAKARFEVGWFETGCGQRIVHAVVEKGRVARLEIEPCPDPVRLTPEMRALVQAARKALWPKRTAAFRRVGVRDFISNANGLTIEVYGCFTICIFGWCLSCCFGLDDPALNVCTLT